MAARWVGSDIYAMKTIKLLTLIGAVLVGLGPAVWAGPRGGGGGFAGGGHVGGGGRVGGFAGGGSRYAPAFYGGGFRAGPTFRGWTLLAEVSTHSAPHRNSIMVVIGRLPWRRADSLAQLSGPRAHISADRLRQLGHRTR